MYFLAPYYEYIYTIVCSLAMVTFSKVPARLIDKHFASNKSYSGAVFFLLFFLVVFLGARPITPLFGDTAAYAEMYVYMQNEPFYFQADSKNVLFDNLFALSSNLGVSYNVFLTIMDLIYFSCIAIACRKMFPENYAIAICAYLVAFETYSFSINGYKAGVGATIFLVALAYKDKLWLTIPLALLSIGFHHSMKVVVFAYLIAYFYRNTKYYFYAWVVCVVLAVLHVGYFQVLFAGLADETGAKYLTGTGSVNYMTGFRPDFILYSAAPVFIGYKMYIKNHIRNKTYEMWLRLYLLMNSVWMLCMYASYTNRIAYLSWFMYPFVLLYPYYAMYTSDDQLIKGRKVLMYHMSFTLFMVFIYYTLIK